MELRRFSSAVLVPAKKFLTNASAMRVVHRTRYNNDIIINNNTIRLENNTIFFSLPSPLSQSSSLSSVYVVDINYARVNRQRINIFHGVTGAKTRSRK